MIPEAPQPTETQWSAWAKKNNFVPLFFDWYRWVGNIVALMAFIRPDSRDFSSLPPREYHLLSGLMARCSRLMLSILSLTHEGKFGEAATIVHRSLTETAAKLIWLCLSETSERSARLVADGLKPEIEFRRIIQQNIDANDGLATELEERMLRSMDRHFAAAEMTDADIMATPKLPGLASIFEGIGWSRLQYVVLQRLGSHAVHGTWPSLLTDYLTDSDVDGYRFMPKGEPVSFHVNHYMMGSRLVLDACAAYANYCFQEKAAVEFSALCDSANESLQEHYKEAISRGL